MGQCKQEEHSDIGHACMDCHLLFGSWFGFVVSPLLGHLGSCVPLPQTTYSSANCKQGYWNIKLHSQAVVVPRSRYIDNIDKDCMVIILQIEQHIVSVMTSHGLSSMLGDWCSV